MPSKKHLHSYKRDKQRRNCYLCTDPECSHYTTKDFLLGKAAACAQCGEKLILTAEILRKRNPIRCNNCLRPAEVKVEADIFDKIFAKVEQGEEE